ncbi:hypothetical protein [Crassaminicella profunda]|uniref:hypothetical protein n=1 Tax=Crassaminicella profunda TaxID=1286698 RepID=UPI001CA75F5C|nr:hypothetical protein [Crassaminicella profunda]QZY56736.1 hypothetical protein K7H06_07385 [Crassaminicella profunda]
MNGCSSNEYYKTVVEMIKTMGVEGTDDFLKKELSDMSKNVAYIREKVATIQYAYEKETNSDTLMHLRHDSENMIELLNNLLKKLETIDKRYMCLQEYLRRNNRKEIVYIDQDCSWSSKKAL